MKSQISVLGPNEQWGNNSRDHLIKLNVAFEKYSVYIGCGFFLQLVIVMGRHKWRMTDKAAVFYRT